VEPDAYPRAQAPGPAGDAPADPASVGGALGPRRTAVISVAVAVVVHVILLATMWWAGERRTPPVVAIDIETVPIAPEAEELAPEEEAQLPEPPPPAEDEAPAPPADEPQLPPEPPPVEEAAIPVDAGVDAEQVAAIDAGVDAEQIAAVDAGVDAEQVAAADGDAGLDGGDGDADAGAEVAAGDGDAGVEVATADGDGGVEVAAADGDGGIASDGGVGSDGGAAVAARDDVDRAGNPDARPSSGTKADLIKYFPRGHVVSVLVRLDRLRDTAWADAIEGVLRPLPDRASLVGADDVRLLDRFDTLAFSSPRPESVVDTTVVARTRMAPSALRTFLDQPDAPVAWSVVTGGALGRRGKSPRLVPGDRRVFLLWQRGWATLADPRDLTGLRTPAAGDLDAAAAAPAALPPWLAAMATIEDESGHPDGPAVMVTAAGMFPAQIGLPIGGATLPGPDAATVTLELDPAGFVVKGNLRFSDESAAATAADALARVRAELLDDRLASMALRQFRAYNAVNGLSVKRTGRRVAFATSISTADGQALLQLVTNLLTNHFEAVGQRGTPPATAPAP